jgi:acetyl/propionyl-CoA carboxylase alpha subunit
VEHPVTEWITGFSRITNQGSQGEALEMKQEDLKIKGHAGTTVYAEDSMNDFYQA